MFQQRASIAVLLSLGLVCSARAQAVELVELQAADAKTGDRFGLGVSISGDRALVGAPGNGAEPGAAYVFDRKSDGTWTQTAKLVANDPQNGADLGYALALQGDRALVGAPDAFNPTFHTIGAAFVFERDATGVWTQVAKLTSTASGPTEGDFGDTVALSGDRAIVGDSSNDAAGSFSGSAHVFERDAIGAWIETAVLHASDTAPFLAFGVDVAIDGDRALVGSLQPSKGAYLFERSHAGTWIEVTHLIPPTGDGGHIALQGDRALVGRSQLSVHVFERQPSGAWIPTAELVAGDGTTADQFGFASALSGERALIGAFTDDDQGLDSGSAYVFEHQAGGTWIQTAKLLAPGGVPGDWLGHEVALDGDRALAGGLFDSIPITKAGAASLFDLLPLSSATTAVSKSLGGKQDLDLDAGHLHAGQPYLLIGSASGTSPGFTLPGGVTMPLVKDGYTRVTAAQFAFSPLIGSAGVLNAAGSARSVFKLAPGATLHITAPAIHHAFATIDPSTSLFVFASNAFPVLLLP